MENFLDVEKSKNKLDTKVIKELQTAWDLIKDFERIPKEENVDKTELSTKYKNNFWVLLTVKFFPENQEDDVMDVYEQRLRSLDKRWNKFTKNNPDLVSELKKFLGQLETVHIFNRILFKLLREGETGDIIEEIENSIHPTLGIQAVSAPIWRQLNPLLEKTEQMLQTAGVDTEHFGG